MKPDYLDTARAFDAVASHYDAVYGPQGNAVMTWMRQESLALLKATFPPGSYLLEIGCGTGEEALALARSGRRVLATDISPKMASTAQAKARAAGLGDRVVAMAAPAATMGALHPTTPFDGAYASFGALNCEPHLERLGAALARLIKPDGAFVCSVMGRCCPFEMAWFLLHGRPRVAFRRLHRGWRAAPVAGNEDVEVSVATRYLSVRDVKQAFCPAFAVERTLSLPVLLPPPYLDAIFRRHRGLFRTLGRLERQLRQRWPWRLWGDHVALVLRRAS
jgi:ubiquinone/menaquinone biosynthesis C-methylase UbiE